MTRKQNYVVPESDLRTIKVGRVVCASFIPDKFETEQNEDVIENEFDW